MKHQYDWSKLDAGWYYVRSGSSGNLVLTDGDGATTVNTLESESPLDEDPDWTEFKTRARAQLAKCRVVDNAPLFEAMDKMAAEIPAEEWKKVPQVVSVTLPNGETLELLPWASRWYSHGDYYETSSEALAAIQPEVPPPWRRGPLAAWKLVNISCHDGRLTVVMKRGRGELIIETGPDDETLWERLGAKASTYQQR